MNHEEQQRIRDNISLEVTAEHHTPDAVHIEATAHVNTDGVSVDEARAQIARDFGDEALNKRRNMASAAFSASRWKSPWTPSGDVLRGEKPPYNPDLN